MTHETTAEQVAKKTVVYNIPAADEVVVRRDLEYGSPSGPLTLDLYRPPEPKTGTRIPAVVLVAGYPGTGVRKRIGCAFKEMGSTVSWARLIAASGMGAIAYTNREPAGDLHAVLDHLRRNASSLLIDDQRLGLWASSGNVPVALSALTSGRQRLRCAVLCYGYMLDLEGSTAVAEASRRFGFVNAAAGRSIDDLPRDVALFVARAGRDERPGLNEALDRFVARALARDLALTVTNQAGAPHAFDLFDDSDASRDTVEQVLAFLQARLLAAPIGR
jgi:hypothetical protein